MTCPAGLLLKGEEEQEHVGLSFRCSMSMYSRVCFFYLMSLEVMVYVEKQ